MAVEFVFVVKFGEVGVEFVPRVREVDELAP